MPDSHRPDSHRKGTLKRIHRPLVKGKTREVAIVHENRDCVQFEFYIPATVYLHSAVIKFLEHLSSLAPGATISKGAIGSWKGGEEDVNIFRLILVGKFDRDAVRSTLHEQIADVMASLAESSESLQKEVIFTETDIRMDRSILRLK